MTAQITGYLFAAVVGLALGSFLNTLADRLPQGDSIVRPASHCPGCGRRLRWWELLPVLSYLLLWGRCRTCQNAIGWRSPAVEALTGLVALAAAWRVGFSLAGALTLAVGGVLICLSATDLEHRLLPDRLTLPLLAGGLAWALLAGPGARYALWGVLFCGGLLLVVGFGYRILTRRSGMGGGDPKLAAGLGAWLGPQAGLEAVVWGAIVGAIVGLVLIALKRADRKTPLHFGPFLALSGLAWLLIRPPFSF